jgi:hypothetical protein
MRFVACLMVALCLGAAGAQVFALQRTEEPRPTVKDGPRKATGAKWRYKLVRLVFENQLDTRANEEAQKGWEVDQVVLANDKALQYSILFRRPADVSD